MSNIDAKKEQEIRDTLQLVYDALKERGFMDPLNQIWLYLMTEDEIYITTYNDARKKMMMCDRDDIGRCLLENYLKK